MTFYELMQKYDNLYFNGDDSNNFNFYEIYATLYEQRIDIFPINVNGEYANKVEILFVSRRYDTTARLTYTENDFLETKPEELKKALLAQVERNLIEINRIEKLDFLILNRFISELKKYDYGTNVTISVTIKSDECNGSVFFKETILPLTIFVKRKNLDSYKLSCELGFLKPYIDSYENVFKKLTSKIKKMAND